MKVWRVLRTSLVTARAHRVKSALTMSGVGVAVVALVVVSAATTGARAELEASLGTLGAHLLVVRPAEVQKTPARPAMAGPASTLTRADAVALTSIPDVSAVAPVSQTTTKLYRGGGGVMTDVLGTTAEFFAIRNYGQWAGRLFTPGDSSARRVVLGGRLAENLFGDQDPVGNEVHIGSASFTVIGVLASKGSSSDGANADNQAFIPIDTAMRRLTGRRFLDLAFVGVSDESALARVEADIRELLRDRHRLAVRGRADDFSTQHQDRVVSSRSQSSRWFVVLATGLAIVASLLGGAGVLGLMLLAVRERTSEIGLRVAVGARPRDILVQFLAEAVAITALGGAAGVVVGLAGTLVVAVVTGWSLIVSPQLVLLAMAMAILLGVCAGAVPAVRAALLPPVRALALG